VYRVSPSQAITSSLQVAADADANAKHFSSPCIGTYLVAL